MEGYKAKPPIGSDYLLLQAVRKKGAGSKERARSPPQILWGTPAEGWRGRAINLVLPLWRYQRKEQRNRIS